MRHHTAARRIALLIALTAGLSVLAQGTYAYGNLAQPDLAGEIWRMAGYFTILTNIGILAHYAALAMGRGFSAARHGGLMVAIGMVGLYSHSATAGTTPPPGLGWWADLGLHTAVPLMVALWWVAFAPKAPLRWPVTLLWLVWPLAYFTYAIARGMLTGFWPYGFLDLHQLGPAAVLHNVARIAAAFAVLSAMVFAVARISR